MDVTHLLPLFLGLGLLLCLSAFFSGSETALCALKKGQIERLRMEKKKSSHAIVNFVDNPHRLFITILLGNVLVNVSFATLASALIYTLFSEAPAASSISGTAVAVATLLITIFLLVFGEITPKTYAIRHAEPFARVTARTLWGFSVLITPARVLLEKVTNVLLPLFGGSKSSRDDHITADDLRAIVSTPEENILQNDEREMLDNILELRDIEAKEIMVPRIEMVAMNASSTIQDVLSRAKATGFSRIPIYREQIDKLCGIFHVKDLPLWSKVDLRDWTVEDFLEKRQHLATENLENTLVRPPHFAFKTKKLTDLFADLTHRKTETAILIDEYGGVAGSVTLEDIVEEIVGDILDEYDHILRDSNIIPNPENPSDIRLVGRVSVREINQQFRLRIDEDIADSMGGYVFALFGRIPSVGESITDDNGIRFEITAIEGNSISGILMTLPQDSGIDNSR